MADHRHPSQSLSCSSFRRTYTNSSSLALGKGRLPRTRSSATYCPMVLPHRLRRDGRDSAASRRRACSRESCVIEEHTRKSRSKHQYANCSRGSRFPDSVVPCSYLDRTWTKSSVLLLVRREADSCSSLYTRLPFSRTFPSIPTSQSGSLESPRWGTTSISSDETSARSKLSSAS